MQIRCFHFFLLLPTNFTATPFPHTTTTYLDSIILCINTNKFFSGSQRKKMVFIGLVFIKICFRKFFILSMLCIANHILTVRKIGCVSYQELMQGLEVGTESWFLHSKGMNVVWMLFQKVHFLFYGQKLYLFHVTEFIVCGVFEQRKRKSENGTSLSLQQIVVW